MEATRYKLLHKTCVRHNQLNGQTVHKLQIATFWIHIYIYVHIVVSLTLIKTTFFGSGHDFQVKLLRQNKLYIYIYIYRERERDIIKFCVCKMVVLELRCPGCCQAASKVVNLMASDGLTFCLTYILSSLSDL